MPIKVLVADDEPDLEFLINRRFRKRIRTGKLQFIFVRNGVEALEKLQTNPDVNVVLSDISMPQMDGLTLLARLNELYPLLSTIIISAYGDMKNIRIAMNRGAFDFLTKPISFQDLEITLEKTIRHVHQLKEAAEHARLSAEAQKARTAAEAATEAKSAFLANMSHELRTPLNSILGYTQILKREKSLTEKQQHEIDIIHRSGEHLLTVINDILDLSKIEAGQMKLSPENFQLPDMLKMIVEMVRIRSQYKGISLNAEIPSNLPKTVYGDEKRLRQILLNLLGNAVKFTDQGNVTLRVSRSPGVLEYWGNEKDSKRSTTPPLHHPTTPPPHHSTTPIRLRFEVEDTGIGIPPAHLHHIFSAFQQIPEKRFQAGGTGLGLAISQRFVRMMGGELQVKSVVGQGSTFWFEVELPEGPEVERKKDAAQRNIIGFKGEPRKILIADDNEADRVVLKDLFAPLGFEIIEAVDGHDALNKTVECHPDIVFMDVVMPEITGLEVTRRIRQIPELKDVVVITMSADVLGQSQQKSAEVGCDDYITKPFEEASLLERLQIHLQLEWVYEEDSSKREVQASEEMMVLPSQEELDALFELAMMGAVPNIQKRIHQLEASDPQLLPFGAKLSQYADAFMVEEMQAFLRNYIPNKDHITKEPSPFASQDSDKASILFVDDDLMDSRALIDYLNEVGFTMFVARSGEAAIQQLKYAHPDLILVDVIMPGLDGFETCRRLKANEETREIPVIFITTINDATDKGQGFNMGGVDYITKPFQHEVVLARINAHLTLRKQHQQIQAQQSLLEEKNRQERELDASQNDFFPSILQELQTPFTELFDLTQFMTKNLDYCSQDEIKEIVHILQKSVENLYELLENFTTWSDIRRGIIEPHPEYIDLRELVARNITLLRLNAEQKHILLKSLIQEETSVYADKRTVCAVVCNLLLNALKFVDPGSKISITATQDGDFVKVAVSEIGPGIPEENVPNMLQIDTKYQGKETAGEQGTSLELNLSKKLVEKNGGRIWVEREAGKGTTYTFTLPKTQKR
jgi:signal transduction histidine kinase